MKSITKIKNKKGMMVKEILELILAAAGIFLLLVLFFNLMRAGFDGDKETAKSYMGTLKREIAKADKGSVGEFVIWENKRMFLVYFGDGRSHEYSESEWGKLSPYPSEEDESSKHFFKSPGLKNAICICYDLFEDDERVTINIDDNKFSKTSCSSCVSLSNPVLLKDFSFKNEWGPWALKRNDKIKISKQGDRYVFFSSNMYFFEAEILGKKRAIEVVRQGDEKFCSFGGLTKDDLGGYGELAGGYAIQMRKDGTSILHYADEDILLWDSSVDSMIPMKEPSPVNEEVRQLRIIMEKAKDSLKLDRKPNSFSEPVETNIDMEMTSEGLKSRTSIGTFIFSRKPYSYDYELRKLEKDENGEENMIAHSDSAISESFRNSLNNEKNGFIFEGEKFFLEVYSFEDIFNPLNNNQLLCMVPYFEINGMHRLTFYCIDSGGEMYLKNMGKDILVGPLNLPYNRFEKLSKTEIGGLNIFSNSANYIYLEDGELGKSKILESLKNQLSDVCK